MKYFLLGLLPMCVWPAADLPTGVAARNKRLHVSEELQYVMQELGVTHDPGAARVFMEAISRPVHHYVSNKLNRPAQLKQLPQEESNALLRAQSLCRCLEGRGAYFPSRPWEGRFWQCVYYGAVPAMYAVNRYYRAKNKIREMIPLMQKAYFWDEYGAMCGASKNSDDRLLARDHVLKVFQNIQVPISLAYTEAWWHANNYVPEKK